MKAGQNDLAVQNCEMSLKLNPGSQNLIDMLNGISHGSRSGGASPRVEKTFGCEV